MSEERNIIVVSRPRHGAFLKSGWEAIPRQPSEEEGIADNCDSHNKPRLRRCLVLHEFSKRSGVAKFAPPSQPEADLTLYQSVHSAGLLDFLSSAWREWEGLGENGRDLDCCVPVVGVEGDDYPNPTTPPLIPCHAPLPRTPYERPGRNVMGKMGYYCTDQCTPIVSSLLEEIQWDGAVVREAVERSIAGDCRVAFALTTHPGHHGAKDSFGGYCYVNHAAMAARLFQRKFSSRVVASSSKSLSKVAILDVDYHCGNGTASIFYSDSSVLVASIHCDPDHEYPFNAGFADQIGADGAEGATLHLPLPPGTTWENGYKGALKKALVAICEFGAEALVVSLGLDTYADDEIAVRRAGFKLSCATNDYTEMGRTIGLGIDASIPTIFIQEGGYKMDVVAQAASDVVTGFCLC